MKVDIDKKIVKHIKKLSRAEQPKIVSKIYELQEVDTIAKIPHDGKLKGYSDRYKIRTGNYRIIYKVASENHIQITAIAHRKDIYNKLFGVAFSF